MKNRHTIYSFIVFLIASLIIMPSIASDPKSVGESIKFDFDRLNAAEKNRVRVIITWVGREPSYLTTEIHKEFWVLLSRAGEISDDEVLRVRDQMTGVSSKYMRYFYEDALWALSSGHPFKSSQREKYEEYLLEIGAITQWRIRQNEQMIEKISYKEPIQSDGGVVVYDEGLIKEILGNLEETSQRFNRLFTR